MKPSLIKLAKNVVNHAATSAGLTVIPDWRMRQYELSTHLGRLFESLQIQCVLDVGANAGQYGRFLRQEAGYNGVIVSFEPVPDAFAALQQAAGEDPRWLVFQHALGSQEGTAEFNIMFETQFSSFHDPSVGADVASAAVARNNQVVRRVTVGVRSINQVLPEIAEKFGFERFYLKLDTQGYDLTVMNGAGDVLSSIYAMQSEVPVLQIYEGAPGFHEYLRFYFDQGFQPTGFFVMNRDAHLRVIDFDCVMVNRSRLPSSSDNLNPDRRD